MECGIGRVFGVDEVGCGADCGVGRRGGGREGVDEEDDEEHAD